MLNGLVQNMWARLPPEMKQKYLDLARDIKAAAESNDAALSSLLREHNLSAFEGIIRAVFTNGDAEHTE